MEGLTTAPISPLRFEPSAVLKSAVALCKQLYICFSVQYSVQNIIKLFFLAKQTSVDHDSDCVSFCKNGLVISETRKHLAMNTIDVVHMVLSYKHPPQSLYNRHISPVINEFANYLFYRVLKTTHHQGNIIPIYKVIDYLS